MIWPGIVDRTIIGPFKIDEGVKINRVSYCAFLERISFFQGMRRNFKDFHILTRLIGICSELSCAEAASQHAALGVKN